MVGSSAIGTRKNIKVLEELTSSSGRVNVQILEYENLLGCTNISTAMGLFFMRESNIRVRQIAIEINNAGIKIEPGAMSYFKGHIEMVSGLTVSNALGRIVSGALTGEKAAQPEYKGTGLIVLEPSFKHFIPVELSAGEQIITDKGMFYCAESSVEVKPIMNKTISGALLGGEGIFQLALKGPGLVVLESPVPMCEIDMMMLNNEELSVDGSFALLRDSNISFSVTRSAKTLIGSAMSGEGLVNKFSGTGQVWLAPTLKAYEAISIANRLGGDVGAVDMNTSKGNVTTYSYRT